MVVSLVLICVACVIFTVERIMAKEELRKEIHLLKLAYFTVLMDNAIYAGFHNGKFPPKHHAYNIDETNYRMEGEVFQIAYIKGYSLKDKKSYQKCYVELTKKFEEQWNTKQILW